MGLSLNINQTNLFDLIAITIEHADVRIVFTVTDRRPCPKAIILFIVKIEIIHQLRAYLSIPRIHRIAEPFHFIG